MTLIIYKNNRKYSNIKFGSSNECLDFIKFNGTKAKDTYDMFEYPSGEFFGRYAVDDQNSDIWFCVPTKTPRKRRFK